MKIVRAMKHVKRLQGEIKELQKRAASCLNTLEGNEFSENFKDVMDDIIIKKEKLRSLKDGIMKANINGNMFIKILQLGELKSSIDFVRELEPKIGFSESRFNMEKTKYISQWTITERNAKVQDLQAAINALTDELDDFNAKADIL